MCIYTNEEVIMTDLIDKVVWVRRNSRVSGGNKGYD